MFEVGGESEFHEVGLARCRLPSWITPEDRHLLTVNMYQDMYQYTHLCVSFASALAMWQKAMDRLCDDFLFTVDELVFT